MAVPAALPPLAVIAGPTAGGKSALALRLAEVRGGIVINADASQLYRDLRVLTARPSIEEEARASHRLYGVLEGTDSASAAWWAEAARAEIATAHAAGRLPILVGGTGLYLRTLIDGIAPTPAIDAGIRAAVRALPAAEVHAALAREDADAAARLHPSDRQRTARALEVIRSTGVPLARWHERREGGIANGVTLHAYVVERSVDELARAIDARLDRMIADGALDEVAALTARGLDPGLPVMKAVGVRPLAAHLRGEISLAEAITRAAAETRQYAKRQRTWFRHQTPAWTRVGPDCTIAAVAGGMA